MFPHRIVIYASGKELNYTITCIADAPYGDYQVSVHTEQVSSGIYKGDFKPTLCHTREIIKHESINVTDTGILRYELYKNNTKETVNIQITFDGATYKRDEQDSQRNGPYRELPI